MCGDVWRIFPCKSALYGLVSCNDPYFLPPTVLRLDTLLFESQAILLDCRNFDPDAKKGTTRDVEAGCALAKFEQGQQKHHNNIYNNIENILSKKVLCLKCRYHTVPHFDILVILEFWDDIGIPPLPTSIGLRFFFSKFPNFGTFKKGGSFTMSSDEKTSLGLASPEKHSGGASEGWQELV